MIALALALLVTACEPDVAATARPYEAPMGSSGPLDALSRRFGRVRAGMRERGYGDARNLARVFALEGEGVALPLDLPTHECTAIVALAGAGMREVDLTLYDGEGVEVARDTVEGEGALVYACPESQGPTAPHYAVLGAASGGAAVIVATFQAERGRGTGFDGVFEGVLSPRVPYRDVEEALARSRATLRSRGLQPLFDPEIASVASGEPLRRMVTMEQGRCYVAMVRAGAGVRDVDLSLFSAAGAEIARDLEGDAEPTLRFCPTETSVFTFEARVFEGQGALGLMVLDGDPEADPEAPSVAADEQPRMASALRAPEPRAAVLGIARSLAPRHYGEPIFVVEDGTIAPFEMRSHDVLVAEGCTLFIGASGGESTDLDLYLFDGDGRVLSRDTGIQPVARASACAAEPTVVRVAVKSYGEHGTYALAIVRAPDTMRSVRALRLDEATSSLRSRGLEQREDAELVLEEGERFDREVEIAGGTCVAFAVAGEMSVEDVDLFFRDEEGNLVASESGPAPYAALTRCVEHDESLRLEVVMYRGAGAVTVERLEGRP